MQRRPEPDIPPLANNVMTSDNMFVFPQGYSDVKKYFPRGRRQDKNVTKSFKKSNNLEFGDYYLESLWEIHSNKYKHAWYWFRNV